MRIFEKYSLLGYFVALFVAGMETPSFANECCECASFTIEAKAAYIAFSNDQMRDVYDKGGYQLQLSGDYALTDIWHLYGSMGYIGASGKSTHFKQNTQFYQIPVDIGLKPIIPINSCLDWYMALGPRFFYAHQHNHSDYVSKNVSKGGVGLFVNSGLTFTPASNYYLDLFGEYSYQPLHPSSKHGSFSRKIDVGGFSIGAGFGFML
jgi:opacity protein-like surface antigen